MSDIEYRIISTEEISDLQNEGIARIQFECFSDVPTEDIEEDFIAEKYARMVALKHGEIIGTLGLFKRDVGFNNQNIVLGGMGGVCVAVSERGKGIATEMLMRGLEELRRQGCDIACLNVDLKKQAYRLYEKIGFTMMERQISFENSKGIVKYDRGSMFIPVCSQEVYDMIMNSSETFHYGKGYW